MTARYEHIDFDAIVITYIFMGPEVYRISRKALTV